MGGLVSLNAFGGGEPGNLRAWQKDQANATTRGFFRNTLRTLDRIELLPATHLPEEKAEVLNQSGEVVIASAQVCLVNHRPRSVS